MMPRLSSGWLSRTGLVVALVGVAAFGLHAQPAAPLAPVASAPMQALPAEAGREEGARWQSLTQGQRQALGPLQHDWSTMDVPSKQKWLTIADRFHTLSPQEQARISERMTEWSRMSPLERGEARMRFQEARQLPAPDRSARWEAYQKLPPDEKQRLLARANAFTPGASGVRRPGPPRDSQAKANVVPNPALAQPPRPVSPTMVQASPGATTRLITKPTMPPAHQQTGMPKIAATPEFVNRSTLLPRRGPQAATVSPAVTPAPGNGPLVARQVLPARPIVAPASAPAASTPAR